MELRLISKDTETVFGHASGPAVCPPEEDHRIAYFAVYIGKSEIEALVDGMEEGFELDELTEGYYEDCKITLVFFLRGNMVIGRTGAVYERMRS